MALMVLGLVTGIDLWIRRGMVHVMNPPTFTEKRSAFNNLMTCGKPAETASKLWELNFESLDDFKNMKANAGGFGVSGIFDVAANEFYVQIENNKFSLTEVLTKTAEKKFKGGLLLWMGDIAASSVQPLISYLKNIEQRFGLQNKLIVQSSNPEALQFLCAANIATCYHIPFLNPYKSTEGQFIKFVDDLNSILAKHKFTYLGATYYQEPVLNKFYPQAKQILWIDRTGYSPTAHYMKARLLKNDKTAIVLAPR